VFPNQPWLPILIAALCLFLPLQQSVASEQAIWSINAETVQVQIVSSGSYRHVKVTVINRSDASQTVSIDYGAIFKSANDAVQNLAVVFPKSVVVAARQTETVTVKTTCTDAKKRAPSRDYRDWTPKQDAALGDLLRFYDVSRPLIETLTGPQHHDTVEKRHNFLQILVWTYYGNDKKHMKAFVKTYMTDGDESAANALVDELYPVAKVVIDLYKKGHSNSFPLPF